MKHKIYLSLAPLLIHAMLCGQSAHINYAYKGWSTCNAFATPTDVNGFIHQTAHGRPGYTDNSVQLATRQTSVSTLVTTIYSIAFNFKVGFHYTIQVQYRGEKANSDAQYPAIQMKLSQTNGGTETDTTCDGPQPYPLQSTANWLGGPSGPTYGWATYYEGINSQSASYLLVAAFPDPASRSLAHINIRQILITEMPPPGAFSISPTSATTNCLTPSLNFTINNNNNMSGVNGYVWDLGPNNGWIYQGSTAPTTPFTTSTATISLTPQCSAGTQSSVKGSVMINSISYPVGTATVTPAPSFPISNSSPICSGSQTYSINLPCNAAVSWDIQPLGIVTSSASGNSITLTKSGNGKITLTATVTACGGTYTSQKDIVVGLPPSSNLQIYGDGPTVCQNVSVDFGAFYQDLDYCSIAQTGGTNINWYVFSNGHQITNNSGNGVCPSVNNSGIEVAFSQTGSFNIAFSVENACGTSGTSELYSGQVISGSFCDSWTFMASPNPAYNIVEVSLDETTQKDPTASKIKEVKIVDKMGTTVKVAKHSAGVNRSKIDVSSLKPDTYIIQVSNGKEWKSKLLLVK